MNRRRAILAFLAASFNGSALAQAIRGNAPSVALKGHDPVAYFLEARPVKGTSSIAYDFDDSRYLFANAKNRELFASNPDRYTPQFAGLCTTGLALGMKTEADPNMFVVRDGKLYVFSSAQARDMAEKDPSMLAKAHQSWGGRK
jgi:YHS domain-containing protein